MSSKGPVLGSLAVQGPTLTPQIVHVSKSTCSDLSLFKELLREYRMLDDTINMRLNRAGAAIRDQERERPGKTTVQDQACGRIWQELTANWKRRQQLIEYCASVIDETVNEKQEIIQAPDASPAATRKAIAEKYTEQVKRNQIHNELTVEMITRKRSLEAFKTRCKYFAPPFNDVEGQKLWDEQRPVQ
ncbi:hypothetical protein E1B28_004378 [Marasmius oreades]|uniref:Coiled-coil domain-containing protein 58 n=1 Tax=Marasmius oreades TaxID=181124 RepID=A0A9P7UYI0_9AGAR|nr:uncharacterized protein E1B28_004378 [Marasmius oreades]KAG7096983.1 hypothetical protein E1B28_004378 [Marasmius oreades]